MRDHSEKGPLVSGHTQTIITTTHHARGIAIALHRVRFESFPTINNDKTNKGSLQKGPVGVGPNPNHHHHNAPRTRNCERSFTCAIRIIPNNKKQ